MSGVWATGRKRLCSPSSPELSGRILVISGPSGSGKSSIIRKLVDRVDIGFSVSATTREARPSEVDGVDYFFVSREEFRDMIERDDFLEWAVYNDDYYGTPAGPVADANAAGRDVLLDIELQGARQVKDHRPDAVMIFIAAPSLQEMERRLRQRGDTSEEDIAARIGIAEAQLEEAEFLFDFTVVNEDLDVAVDEVVRLVTGP